MLIVTVTEDHLSGTGTVYEAKVITDGPWYGLTVMSKDPEYSMARELVKAGYEGKFTTTSSGESRIVPHSDVQSKARMIVDAKKAAKYKIEEGKKTGPRRTKWRPMPKYGLNP